jgi:DNA-binding MarR family transcriptional regulator
LTYVHNYDDHLFDHNNYDRHGIDPLAKRESFTTKPPPPDPGPKPPLVEFRQAVPPVRRVLMALARRLFQISTTAIAEVLHPEDLTPLQYALIAYVEGEPDLDQNSVAARIGIDRNNASLVVDQLEKKGLIERRVNGADRRARLLRITPRCKKLYDRLRPSVFHAQEQLLSLLSSDEREQLLDMLVRVIEGNRGLARPGSGRRKRRPAQPASRET